jgi:DNA (cytosine-5)-methyltransferase 1
VIVTDHRFAPPRDYRVPHVRGLSLRLSRPEGAPDPADEQAARRWVRAARSPTAIDVFCGAGGLSLGLRDAGFTILSGADSDATAVETHTANLGGLGYVGDLADPDAFLGQLRRWGIRTVDLVAGGVPCQPFSNAGRAKIRSLVAAGVRPEHDPRADLWRSFVAIVEGLRPRAVLLENVPDLAIWNDGAVLAGLGESLRALGYATDAMIVNAYEFGVPQHRARLILVGRRPGLHFNWPAPSNDHATVRDAIGDLPEIPPGQREERIPYPGPTTPLARDLRHGVAESESGWVYDHIARDVRGDDAEAFANLKPGGTYADLPDHLRRYRSDIFADKYKRLEWESLSRSITAHIAKDGYWYIHPNQDRTLSIREAARIQTFPDWYRFAGRPSVRYKQIGNAVPPLLARAIGGAIAAALRQPARRGRPRGSGRRFREQLLGWYESEGRKFPWRSGVDPWRVLMAEVCLRRTRADQVVPVFEALSQIAPTPEAMIQRETEVFEAMRSLGLRWRADNMLAIARALVHHHDGRVPDSFETLLALPGVGDYVAQAVLIFGFGKRGVVIDTNTQRIAARLFRRQRMKRWQVRLDLQRQAGLDGSDASLNYALLDLGALVCQPGQPRCDACPVRRHCATFASAS